MQNGGKDERERGDSGIGSADHSVSVPDGRFGKDVVCADCTKIMEKDSKHYNHSVYYRGNFKEKGVCEE